MLRRVLELCLRAGARLAEPGEFTLRAFTNGRIDLSLAEAVRDVVASRTERALRQALGQAASRGSILHLSLKRDGEQEDVYFLNDEPGRKAVAKIQSGEISLAGLWPEIEPYVEMEEKPDIFTFLIFYSIC